MTPRATVLGIIMILALLAWSHFSEPSPFRGWLNVGQQKATTPPLLLSRHQRSATLRDLARYQTVLSDFDEPPWCSAVPDRSVAESYRFLWLRTFHHPVLVRLDFLGDGRAAVVYKETDGAGGYEIGSLVKNETVDVNSVLLDQTQDPDAVDAALDQIREDAEAQFWRQPYQVDQGLGYDGAMWIVEGWRRQRCHVISRWSPQPQTSVRVFAESILGVTGQNFEHRY